MRRATSRSSERIERDLLRWVAGWSGFRVHCGLFLVGATLLTLLNVARTPESLWFWRPLVAWALLLGLHFVAALRGPAPARPLTQAERGSHVTISTRDALVAVARAARRSGVATARALQQRLHRASSSDQPYAAWPTSAAPIALERPASPSIDAAWGRRTTDATSPPVPPAPSTAIGWGAPHDRQPATFAGAAASPHRAPAASNGTVRPASNGHHPPASPAPTGRFQASELASPPPTATDRRQTGVEEPLPASVAALWAAASTPEAPAVTGHGAPWSTARRAAAPPPRPQRPSVETAQDRVISGPLPVDPNDPRWTWLEAQAAAWLAQREAATPPPSETADVVPTPSDQHDAVRAPR